jgi:DNA-binding MarR family transcriptional regulator
MVAMPPMVNPVVEMDNPVVELATLAAMERDVDPARWDHVGRQVLAIHRDFQSRALAELRRRGHGALSPALIGLLPHLDTGGTRVVDAARRAGISKQAVAKLVRELEALGYVARAPDLADGRAALVTFTARGQELLADIRGTIGVLEAGYAAALGPERFAELRGLLGDLVTWLDPAPDRP